LLKEIFTITTTGGQDVMLDVLSPGLSPQVFKVFSSNLLAVEDLVVLPDAVLTVIIMVDLAHMLQGL